MKLTCKESSELISQSLDRRLNLKERLYLRYHLLICKSCKIVDRQLKFLHSFYERFATSQSDISYTQPGLSTEAQKRILKELHRIQDEH
jgi:hypothetical protein